MAVWLSQQATMGGQPLAGTAVAVLVVLLRGALVSAAASTDSMAHGIRRTGPSYREVTQVVIVSCCCLLDHTWTQTPARPDVGRARGGEAVGCSGAPGWLSGGDCYNFDGGAGARRSWEVRLRVQYGQVGGAGGRPSSLTLSCGLPAWCFCS